jgi:hypothetical protein
VVKFEQISRQKLEQIRHNAADEGVRIHRSEVQAVTGVNEVEMNQLAAGREHRRDDDK